MGAQILEGGRMSDEIWWVLVGVGCLWLTLIMLVVAVGAFVTRIVVNSRELLSQERLAAVAKGQAIKESKRELTSIFARLHSARAVPVLLLIAILLLSFGIGLFGALFFSELQELQKYASCAWVPISMGVGIGVLALLRNKILEISG